MTTNDPMSGSGCPNVNFVLAYNRSNSGMYSVDRAAWELARDSGVNPHFFCAFPGWARGVRRYGPIDLHPIKRLGRSVDGESRLVYWGDFTTSPQYGARNYRKIFLRQWGNGYYYFLPNQLRSRLIFKRWMEQYSPDPRADSFSVGQNFQLIHNDLTYYDPHLVCDFDLERHLERFGRICARDSLSVDEVEKCLPDRDTVSLGMDVAFLNRCGKKGGDAPRLARGSKIGILLHRSGIQNRLPIEGLLDAHGFTLVDFQDRWMKLPRESPETHFMKTIERMMEMDLVISDTYHFLINALRSHVPAIGIGLQCERQMLPVSDLKKRILFDDLAIPDHYLELSGPEFSGSDVEALDLMLHSVRGRFDQTFFGNLDSKVEDFRSFACGQILGQAR